MKSKLLSELDHQIAYHRKELANLEAARALLVPSVKLAITKHHVPAKKPRAKRTTVTADMRKAIEERIARGDTQLAIAKDIGVSASSVKRVVRSLRKESRKENPSAAASLG